ncbi:aromatic prenyltransferase [Streptomyces sp. NPDC054796]
MTDQFDKQTFTEDLMRAARALNAPVDHGATRTVLDTFEEHFSRGAVLWKTTDQPGAQLSYRVFSRLKSDTVALALDAGLLHKEHPLIDAVNAWSGRYGGTPVQSCDFDAGRGLAKTWLWLGGLHPAREILTGRGIPVALTRHLDAFTDLGFDYVRFVACDWRHSTINIYFRARGPLTPQHFGRIVGLAEARQVEPALADTVLGAVPEDYCVAVTIKPDTGVIERVCFYALRIPRHQLPPLPERIRRFFDATPNYDAEECNVVGWSFGRSGPYVKAEHSRSGGMAELLAGWNCLFHGDEGIDHDLRNSDVPSHRGGLVRS